MKIDLTKKNYFYKITRYYKNQLLKFGYEDREANFFSIILTFEILKNLNKIKKL